MTVFAHTSRVTLSLRTPAINRCFRFWAVRPHSEAASIDLARALARLPFATTRVGARETIVMTPEHITFPTSGLPGHVCATGPSALPAFVVANLVIAHAMDEAGGAWRRSGYAPLCRPLKVRDTWLVAAHAQCRPVWDDGAEHVLWRLSVRTWRKQDRVVREVVRIRHPERRERLVRRLRSSIPHVLRDGALLPATGAEDGEAAYILIGFAHSRAELRFLDLSAPFDRSSIWWETLAQVGEYAGEWLRVAPAPRSVTVSASLKSDAPAQSLFGRRTAQAVLSKIGCVAVCDNANQPDHVDALCEALRRNGVETVRVTPEMAGTWRGPIVHATPPPDDDDPADPYGSIEGVVQHVNVYADWTLPDGGARALLRELLVKVEIAEKRCIALPVTLRGPWTFVMGSSALTLAPDGSLTFRNLDAAQADEWVALVVDDAGRRCAIHESEEVLIPKNPERIRHFREGRRKPLTVELLFQAFEAVDADHSFESNAPEAAVDALCAGESPEAVLRMIKTLDRAYWARLLETLDGMGYPRTFSKSRAHVSDTLGAHVCAIVAGRIDGDGVMERWWMAVGFPPASLGKRLARSQSPRLRFLTADAGFPVPTLLALCDTDRVRTGLPTVIPFPFKHLREWARHRERETA